MLPRYVFVRHKTPTPSLLRPPRAVNIFVVDAVTGIGVVEHELTGERFPLSLRPAPVEVDEG